MFFTTLALEPPTTAAGFAKTYIAASLAVGLVAATACAVKRELDYCDSCIAANAMAPLSDFLAGTAVALTAPVWVATSIATGITRLVLRSRNRSSPPPPTPVE